MIADKAYDLSTESRLQYTSDIPIKGKRYVRMFLDSVGEGQWEIIDESTYQVIDDSIVFTTAPTGAYLVMQVATTPTELLSSPTENSLILAIRDEISAVAQGVVNIEIVGDNIDNVNKVGAISDSIEDVTKEPLRQSILDAELNATNAQLRAWEAQAIKMTADSYATEPEDTFVKVYTSNGDGTFSSTPTTEYSALHYASKSATFDPVNFMAAITSIDNFIPRFDGMSGQVQNSNVIIDDNGSIGLNTTSFENNWGNQIKIDDTNYPALVLKASNTFYGRTFLVGIDGTAGGNTRFTVNDRSANAERFFIDANGNIGFNSGYGSPAIAYGCRAWVNFNGLAGGAIKQSGNVSSVAYNAIGDYSINFLNAMPDANYSFSQGTNKGTDGGYPVIMNEKASVPKTPTTLRVTTAGQSATFDVFDPASASIQIYR